MKKSDGGYRAWYYFRNGWSVYFAFIFAAINTLVITYYLAIERAPFLKEIFPSFGFYVIAAIGIGIPLLTIIGWVHWKKSGARRAEVDVNYEANPYEARTMVNTEMVLKLSLQLSEILLKNQNKNTISENEINSIKSLIKEIENHNSKRTFTNKMDIKYIRTETQERTNS
tara:strand:+ start:1095 stop:1604 length:510 start_codon:yes stop_codon:yes gene_type:complete